MLVVVMMMAEDGEEMGNGWQEQRNNCFEYKRKKIYPQCLEHTLLSTMGKHFGKKPKTWSIGMDGKDGEDEMKMRRRKRNKNWRKRNPIEVVVYLFPVGLAPAKKNPCIPGYVQTSIHSNR